MLPDLPKIKLELLEVQMRFFNWACQQESGVFQDCKKIPAYEGHQLGVERPTGESNSEDFWQLSSQIELEPQKEDIGSSFEKIYNMGKHVGKQIERQSFAHLDRVLTEHNQTVDAKGIDPVEGIFEMFDKIQIPLGDDQKLDREGMRIILGEEMMSAVKKMQNSPELTERFEKLMAKKEKEARARETNRKLVG